MMGSQPLLQPGQAMILRCPLIMKADWDMCQMHLSVAPGIPQENIVTHMLKHLIDEAVREGKKQGESRSG